MTSKKPTVPAIRIKRVHNKVYRDCVVGDVLYFFRDGTPAPEPHGAFHFPVQDRPVKAREVQLWIDSLPPYPWRPV